MMTRSSGSRCRELISLTRKYSGLLVRICALAGVALATFAIAGGLLQTQAVDVHASSKGDKAAGAVLFHQSGCEHCHGSDARGTENGPDLSTVGKRLKTEQIERQIREGGRSMPAFGDALQPDQIQDLVAFLHEKKKAPKTSAQSKSSYTPASGPA